MHSPTGPAICRDSGKGRFDRPCPLDEKVLTQTPTRNRTPARTAQDTPLPNLPLMKRNAPTLTALCLAAALPLTACQSHTQSCFNGTCHVTVKGAGQTIEVNDYDVRIREIGPDTVRLQVEGTPTVTLKTGSRTPLGPLTIQVTSIEENTVKFDAFFR